MADRRYVVDVLGRNRLWSAHGELDCVLADLDMVSTWRVDLAGALVTLARRLVGTEAVRYTEEHAGPGTTVACVGCGTTAELPPVPDRPGFVVIEPITGWTAPPPRCPACSSNTEADCG